MDFTKKIQSENTNLTDSFSSELASQQLRPSRVDDISMKTFCYNRHCIYKSVCSEKSQ